jgi:predicted histone-like DNA-binding protein
MSLKFKAVKSYKRGDNNEKQPFWFPQLTGSSKLGMDDVVEIFEKHTTASGGDVHLIAWGLSDLIPEQLLAGHTVRIDGLGTFRLHLKSEPADSPEEVTADNIKEVRLGFIPDTRIKRKLEKATFVKVEEP